MCCVRFLRLSVAVARRYSRIPPSPDNEYSNMAIAPRMVIGTRRNEKFRISRAGSSLFMTQRPKNSSGRIFHRQYIEEMVTLFATWRYPEPALVLSGKPEDPVQFAQVAEVPDLFGVEF